MNNIIKTILLFSCSVIGCNQSSEPASLQLIISPESSGWDYGVDSIRSINITADVYNPTDDTVRYVSMMCSYDQLFITDTTKYRIHFNICFANGPVIESVPPKSKRGRTIRITPADTTKQHEKLKMGMWFIAPNGQSGFNELVALIENKKKGTLIWSREIELPGWNR